MQIRSFIPALSLQVLAVAGVLFSAPSHASLITTEASIADSRHVITFDAFDGLITTGPVNVGAEVGDLVTLTSSPSTELGAYQRSLGNNGIWGVGESFVASSFVTPRGQMTFVFADPVASVGAFFNQYQSIVGTNRLTLFAYDIEGNTLESHMYSIDTDPLGYNDGQFLGIQRAGADIHGFGISDGSFVLDNFTYSVSAVPEPGGVAMFAVGLSLLGWMRRRSSR